MVPAQYRTAQEAAERLGLLINIRSVRAMHVRLCDMRANLGDTGHLTYERRGRTVLYHAESVERLAKRLKRGELQINARGRITYTAKAA